MDSNAPRVLVHEYFTGGGWPGDDLPRAISLEGLAMLRAMLDQFADWGQVRVAATLDSRLSPLEIKASETINLHHGDYPRNLVKALAKVDAALIIAPENDGILAMVNRLVLGQDKILLGTEPEAAELCGDKWHTQKLFEKHGLPVPETRLADGDQAGSIAREVGFPLVVKPCCAADCAGLSLVSSENELPAALDRAQVYRGPVLLQRYIDGLAASVCILAARDGARALSFNLQHLDVGERFAYLGGMANVSHPLREMVYNLALKAVSLVPGLRGFCGVDIVIKDGRSWLMEINPRVTNSFAGLARALGPNLAKALWRACVHNELPFNMDYLGEVSLGGEADYA